MHRWGDVRTSITRLNVYQPSKPQRKLWIWRYLTEDESISLWLPVNLESFVQHPFVIWGRRQMEQRERQAPARLAAKLTPDPLLFLHELQDCITCSPSNQSRQITSLTAAELGHFSCNQRHILSLFVWYCRHMPVPNCKRSNQWQSHFNQDSGWV